MEEYSADELKQLSLEELKKLFLSIRSKILIEQNKNEKTKLEIYYCYIAREVESRV